jgi:hypothetical protein
MKTLNFILVLITTLMLLFSCINTQCDQSLDNSYAILLDEYNNPTDTIEIINYDVIYDTSVIKLYTITIAVAPIFAIM